MPEASIAYPGSVHLVTDASDSDTRNFGGTNPATYQPEYATNADDQSLYRYINQRLITLGWTPDNGTGGAGDYVALGSWHKGSRSLVLYVGDAVESALARQHFPSARGLKTIYAVHLQ